MVTITFGELLKLSLTELKALSVLEVRKDFETNDLCCIFCKSDVKVCRHPPEHIEGIECEPEKLHDYNFKNVAMKLPLQILCI